MIRFLATLYIVLVILQPSEWIRAFEGIPVQELTLVTALAVIILLKSDKLAEVFSSYPSRFFIFFIIISIFSVLPNGDSMSYAFGTIGYKYIKFYIGYLIIVVANDSPEKIRKTIFWTIVSGSIVAYLCVVLKLTGEGVGAGIGVTTQTLNWRGSVQWLGAFGGGNTTGLLLLFIFALSLGCLYKESSKIKWIFYASTTALIGTAFIMTNSRGGLLGFLAILGYYFFINSKMSAKKFVPLAFLVMVLVLVLKPQEEGRGIKESSTPERVELFHQGLQMFKNSPLFGVGSSRFQNNNKIKKTAHNIYLNTLAETGIIGFFCFVAMWYSIVKKISDNISKVEINGLINRNIQTIYLMVIGCGISLFFLSANHELPFIAFAMLTSAANQFNDDYNITTKEYFSILKVIFLLIFSVYMAVQLFFII